MNSFSKKVSNKFIDKLYDTFKDYIIPNPNNPHIRYSFKIKNTSINIYKNNTFLIISNELDKWLNIFKFKKNNYKFNNKYKYEIGLDETGVGDFFGGITVCAVKLDELTHKDILDNYDIKDSKKMSTNQIKKIYETLKNKVDYQIFSFTPYEYNNFINKFHANTHYVKTYLHNEVLNNYATCSNALIILDKYVDENKYLKYLDNVEIPVSILPNVFEFNAESKYLSVALAAIFARAHYLNLLEQMQKKYNLIFPLGSWNEKIKLATKDFVQKYGQNELINVAKLEFKVDWKK